MAVQTEQARLGDLLKWEQDNGYSREKITVVSGQSLELGQVYGIITASGKATAFNQDGDDGSETAAGVMLADCNATSADTKGAGLVRDALIMAEKLVWPDDIDAAEKTAALTQLEALGIVAREEA